MTQEPSYAGMVRVAALTALALMQEHDAIDFSITSGDDPMILTVGAHVPADAKGAQRIVDLLKSKAVLQGYELNGKVGPVIKDKGRLLAFVVIPVLDQPRAH